VTSAARRLASKVNMEAASSLVMLIKIFPKARIYSAASLRTGSATPPRETTCWDKAPFIVIHCILTAAISLLLNAASSTISQGTRGQSISRFRVCVAALNAMEPRWPRARRAMTLLGQLAQRWKIEAALPMHGVSSRDAGDSHSIQNTGTVAPRSTSCGADTLSSDRAENSDVSHLQPDPGPSLTEKEVSSWPYWSSEFFDIESFSNDSVLLDFTTPSNVRTPIDWDYDEG